MCAVATFDAKPSSCILVAPATERNPEYVPGHFLNLINAFLFHGPRIPQILWKNAHNFLSYSANKHTDRLTRIKTLPLPQLAVEINNGQFSCFYDAMEKVDDINKEYDCYAGCEWRKRNVLFWRPSFRLSRW